MSKIAYIKREGEILKGTNTKGKPYRVFFYDDNANYSAELRDEESGETLSIYKGLGVKSILYFKVKNNQELILRCEGKGRFRLL